MPPHVCVGTYGLGSSARAVLRSPSRHAVLRALAVPAMATAVAGCGKQSILSTRSKPAHNIALLWWWMLAAAAVVFLGAVAMLVIAWLRRDRPGLPIFGEREDLSQGMVLVFGIAVPMVALVALFGVATCTWSARPRRRTREHGDDDRRDRPSVVVGGPLPGRPKRSPPTRSTSRSTPG